MPSVLHKTGWDFNHCKNHFKNAYVRVKTFPSTFCFSENDSIFWNLTNRSKILEGNVPQETSLYKKKKKAFRLIWKMWSHTFVWEIPYKYFMSFQTNIIPRVLIRILTTGNQPLKYQLQHKILRVSTKTTHCWRLQEGKVI